MRDLPEPDIVRGDIGAVVHIYSGQRVLEVEFVDGEGKTLSVQTLPMSDVRPIGNHEILHVRRLETA